MYLGKHLILHNLHRAPNKTNQHELRSTFKRNLTSFAVMLMKDYAFTNRENLINFEYEIEIKVCQIIIRS